MDTNGTNSFVANILIDIHCTLLAIEAIILEPDMPEEKREALRDLAINEIENNVAFKKTLVPPPFMNSQNLQATE